MNYLSLIRKYRGRLVGFGCVSSTLSSILRSYLAPNAKKELHAWAGFELAVYSK